MNYKGLGTAAIAVVGILATSGITTTQAHGARGGDFVAASPHAAVNNANPIGGRYLGPARFGAIRNNRSGARGGGDRRDTAILGWPYYPSFEQIPITTSDVQSQPQVIVISGDPAATPLRAAPDASSYQTFVAGCHLIPNGYHCDLPHPDATH